MSVHRLYTKYVVLDGVFNVFCPPKQLKAKNKERNKKKGENVLLLLSCGDSCSCCCWEALQTLEDVATFPILFGVD